MDVINAMPDSILQQYWALAIIDDWGGEWKRTAAVRAEIYNATSRTVKHGSGQRVACDMRHPRDFEPELSSNTPIRRQTASEQMAVLRRISGLN